MMLSSLSFSWWSFEAYFILSFLYRSVDVLAILRKTTIVVDGS